MDIAVISDIHANLEALLSLEDIFQTVDHVLCLGDIIGYHFQVNEVLSYLQALNPLCVMGNHEYFLFAGCPPDAPPAVHAGIAFADQVILPEHRAWLARLPLTWGGILGERTWLLAHGSPWKPLTDYLYADNPALEHLDAFDYDIIMVGQTHRILQRFATRPYLLNPGSVGQSRDHIGYACACIVNTQTLAIQQIIRPYNARPVINLCKQHHADTGLLKYLPIPRDEQEHTRG